MSNPALQLSIHNSIATLSLCNPQRHNALGATEVATFIRLLSEVAGNPAVRVLIITNPEGNSFCAGAALNEIASGQLTSNQFAALPEAVANLRIPTIAALNGSAFGGGAELALSCDFRIGIPHMRLHVPPAKIGLCYPVGGIQRFVNILGVSAAKRLLLANEEFSGEALLNLGFLTHLATKDDLPATALAMAEKIARLAPLAIATMKQLCDHISCRAVDPTTALQWETECNASADLQEGLAAVLEKRPPVFRGR